MEFIIGLDCGGTHTRALAVDLSGNVLAYAEGGSGNPEQNPDAEQVVQSVIRSVIVEAAGQPSDVVGLVAGLAGLNDEAGLTWARRYTDVLGEACPRHHVNDSVVAHAGALLSEPGIIAISGTGWNIYAVTETGRRLNSFNLFHFSGGGSWHLAYGTIQALIAQGDQPHNQPFVERILAHLQLPSIEALREEIIAIGYNPPLEYNERIRSICPLVTAAALNGVSIAQSVCDSIVHGMAQGIQMVGSCFTSGTIKVALMGSILRSQYILRRIELELTKPSCRAFQVVEPVLSGTGGAALMALQQHGVSTDAAMIARLRKHPMAVVQPIG